MSETATPRMDDTTSEQESPDWQCIAELQHTLAKALRWHDDGKPVDAGKVLASVASRAASPASRDGEQQVTVSGLDLVIGYWERIAQRKEAMGTGLGKLDAILGGGLEPGRLIALLGAPGGGKTTLANQIAVHVADAGRPVLYVTSEDMPHALLAKSLARLSGISYTTTLKGYETERARIDQALQDYRERQAASRLVYIDATMGMEIEAVRIAAQAHFEAFKSEGQGVLVIDYLQRLARGQSAYRSGNMELRQAVTVLAEQLRGISTQLDCCVIALASMNRASGYASASNSLSAAKESGDIEYTADVLMSILEDDKRIPDQSWLQARVLKLDKNRQGSTGSIALDWYPERQQFTVAEAEEDQAVSSSNGRRRGR